MTMLEWLKQHIYQIASLALSMVVIYVAIRQGGELASAFKQVRLNWALAGLGCYSVNYLLRALRLQRIMHNRIRIWPDAVYIACLHGLVTYMLPFRSGDFTLPVILKQTVDMTISEGTKVLVKARLLDLCALGGWILIAAVLIDFYIPATIYRLWVMAGIGLIATPLVLQWIIREGSRLEGKLWRWLSKWGGDSFRFQEVFISLAIWACVAGCFYCTARAIGLPLGFMQIWLLITIQLPLQLVPLQGVANTGNHEGGWVAGLAILGIPVDQGLQFALLSHALVLAYVLTLGPVAFFIKMMPKSKNA